MIIPHPKTAPRRRGGAVVDFALVSMVLFMLVFGIIEYCRYIWVLQVCNHAAREGARFAVVNTTTGETTADVTTWVTNTMGGTQYQLQGFNVTVAQCIPGTTTLGTPHTATTDQYYWASAQYGTAIGVQITGNFVPVVPKLLLLPTSVPVTVTAIMYTEAN